MPVGLCAQVSEQRNRLLLVGRVQCQEGQTTNIAFLRRQFSRLHRLLIDKGWIVGRRRVYYDRGKCYAVQENRHALSRSWVALSEKNMKKKQGRGWSLKSCSTSSFSSSREPLQTLIDRISQFHWLAVAVTSSFVMTGVVDISEDLCFLSEIWNQTLQEV